MKENNVNHGPVDEGFVEENGCTSGSEGNDCDLRSGDNVSEDGGEDSFVSENMAGGAAEWRDKYMRLSAEFDNYRKRTLKERIELVSTASEEVIKALLPVIDDMDRALDATETSTEADALREGVVLISNKLRDILSHRGVTEINALGKVLDTDFHEAVAKIPAPAKADKGKVVDVVQKGYRIGEKVIRHSKVVIGE